MRRIKLFLLNGLILTATSFLLRTIGVSFSVYIANKIGSEAVGVFGLVMSIYMFATTFALSGIHLSCIRIVSEELACGLNGNIKKAVKKALLYSLCFGFAACILLFLLAPTISKDLLHNKISAFPFYVVSISLPFVSMSSCLSGYFSAVRRVGKNASIQVIEQIIRVLITAFLLNTLLPNNIDFACLSLVLGTTISEILSFFGNLSLYLWDRKRYKNGLTSHTHFTKRIMKISIPIAITSYIRSGLSTLKQVLIPLRLEKTGMSCNLAISSYGMINGMVMPILFFPSTFINSFSCLLIPEFSSFHTRNEKEKMQIIVKRIFKYTFLFSICIVGIFWHFADQLSLIIYNTTEIAKFLKILSPLVVFMYLDTIVDSILKGIDKQVSVMIINILDLFTSISFIYFLLPIYGILGYLFVIFVSEILNCVLSILGLMKKIELKINWMNWIVKPILSCFFASIVLHLFTFNSATLLFSTIIEIMLFILLYILFLTFTKALNKKDFKL